MLHKLIEFASVGFFIFIIDKFFKTNFPEYQLHKRILTITADYENKNKNENESDEDENNSLNLSHGHNVGGINGFKIIRDLLRNPYHRLHNLSLTRNCGIDYETAKILSEGLSSSNNSSLESLDIGSNRYISNSALKVIVEALSSRNRIGTTLRYLQLYGNGIDVLGAEVIGGILRDGSGIEFLDMRDNRIGDEGVTFLADAMSSLSTSSGSSSSRSTKLVNLDVGRNGIGESGIKALCEMLLKNDTLQHLSLETSYVNDQASEFIVEVLIKNTTLCSLNLQDNSITISGARSIANALVSNTTLKELNLSCNRSMGEDGIEAFAKALSQNDDIDLKNESNDANTTLQILKLDGNRIHLQAATALCTMITHNSTLVQLNLRSCSIHDGAAELIADALRASTCTLKNLNLQGNLIGVVGALHLGRALANKSSLEMLNLAFNNSIGEEGVVGLGKALYGNSTLKVLNLAFSFDCHNHRLGEECAVAQTLRKSLFFPPLSKDGDDTNIASNRRTHHNQKDDIFDLQVGWRSNLREMHLPLDISSPAPVRKHSPRLSNDDATTVHRCPCERYQTSSIYGWTTQAKQKDEEGHLPLRCAMRCNLRWRDGMQKLLEANYLAMEEEDGRTGLLPFMTAAVGYGSDYESVYRLLQQNPGSMVSYFVGR